MRKSFNVLLAGLVVFGLAACEEPQPAPDDDKRPVVQPENPDGPENPDNGDGGQEIPKGEFPYYEDYPIECGNLLSEGTEVGVTIEVTKVEDRNFVFELRPGAMVQSFKMDVYPIAQLYNNLLNDKTSGLLKASESWAVNERIREYIFNESGSGGYAFSVNDFDTPEDFLQVEFDWMNTSYAAASAIAIPDCGYLIAVVASTDTQISSVSQEDLTLCYVHTTSQPLVGDPQCDIEVNAGYRIFSVNHILNSDAAGVYFFGWLQNEIDAYIDTFGDTMFRDFVRTRVTAPSVENDPNNPEALSYSVNYGDSADPTIMSTTVAVAVDANLTPQEGYSRKDFHLKDVPDDLPEAELSVDVIEERVATGYMEFDVNFTKDCQTLFYNVYPESYMEEIKAMSDKDKRNVGRYLRNQGYGCHNPNFTWDEEAEQPTGSGAVVRLSAVGYAPQIEMENSAFVPGESYVVVYVGRNGAQVLTDVKFSEPFTPDVRNLTSPDNCKVKDFKLWLDSPTRTSFRQNITYDPSTVSMVYVQYMTKDANPGLWTDSSWTDWMGYIFTRGIYPCEENNGMPEVNAWMTVPSGSDPFTWTGMAPGVEYYVFACAEDFDGNVSPMFFDSITTADIQVGPDPTVRMELVPSTNYPNDWMVTYTIDHDVEYYLYCYTRGTADLSLKIPGLTQSALNNIKDSGISYETWRDGIYEWVAGGFEDNGGGMRTEGDTSQEWQGDDTVVAACIAVGRDDNGPVYKMYHLICKDGKAQTLEEIFGIE